MKTFDQLEEELAIELGYYSTEEYLEEIRGTFYFEQRLRIFYREVSKRYTIDVIHEAVNDALVKYGKGSNTSAEFVNNWVENNLPKHK